MATSTALTDELVSHGELMSTLLFVEILRARNVQAEWFDVRKVMRTDDHFGRAVPDSAALSELARAQLQPRLQEALVVTRALSAASRKAVLPRSAAAAATIPPRCSARRSALAGWISGPTCRAFTPPIRAWCRRPSASIKSVSKKRRKWPPSAPKSCTPPPCCRRCAATFRFCRLEQGSGGRRHAGVQHHRKSAAVPRAGAAPQANAADAAQPEHAARTRFLAEVFNILARHNISVDLITTSEVSIALTMDTTGATSVGGSLLTTSLLTELSSLCRVEVEENRRWWRSSATSCRGPAA